MTDECKKRFESMKPENFSYSRPFPAFNLFLNLPLCIMDAITSIDPTTDTVHADDVIYCSGCKEETQVSSSTICDLCEDVICSHCTCQVTDCRCCEMILSASQHGTICLSCMVLHWFAEDKVEGFWCTACDEHCTEKTCRVKMVKASQQSCPICFEELNENNYTVQLCEIHGVCRECHYDTNLGCPLCRVGKM